MAEHWADFADWDDCPADLQPTLVVWAKTAKDPEMPMTISGELAALATCNHSARCRSRDRVRPVGLIHGSHRFFFVA